MGMTSSETALNDEEILYGLRNPPTMSMALTKYDLYYMMREGMALAADRIEELVSTKEQLNKNCEALSQLVDSVSESRNFCMDEYVKRCLYK